MELARLSLNENINSIVLQNDLSLTIPCKDDSNQTFDDFTNVTLDFILLNDLLQLIADKKEEESIELIENQSSDSYKTSLNNDYSNENEVAFKPRRRRRLRKATIDQKEICFLVDIENSENSLPCYLSQYWRLACFSCMVCLFILYFIL